MDLAFEAETLHSTGIYAKHPVAFVRGEGATLWDSAGRAYIDCMAGHGVANLGHAHPAVALAVAEQARPLITRPEAVYNYHWTAPPPGGPAGPASSCAPRARRPSKRPSSSPAFPPAGPESSPPCAVSTAGHWAPCRPPGTSTTANPSSRWCPDSGTYLSTTFRHWKRRLTITRPRSCWKWSRVRVGCTSPIRRTWPQPSASAAGVGPC